MTTLTHGGIKFMLLVVTIKRGKREVMKIKYKAFFIPIIVGSLIWLATPVRPSEISVIAWHLLALFLATIVACITQPLPIAGVALVSVTILLVLRLAPIKTTMQAFGNKTVWLVAMAYMISRGFSKTGLGKRMALWFVKLFGKRTLGLAYAIEGIDLVTAPAIPSNTARAGGIIYPIVKALSETFHSTPQDHTERKIGSYLIFSEFHANIITSALFMTAMSPNLIALSLAESFKIKISWLGWFVAASVPGIICLVTVPYLIYRLYPPVVRETTNAREWATQELTKMGAMQLKEKVMLGIFGMALLLWILSSTLNLDATTVAFIAISLLLLTGVLSVQDILHETGAWNVVVWFSILIFMANRLNKLGIIPWLSRAISHQLKGVNWLVVLVVLALVYFYSHYLFASQVAHVAAMYGALLGVAIAAGVPGTLATLILGFTTAIYSSTTQYANGPASVLFGSGYVKQSDWWRLNAILGGYYLLIWIGLELFWLKIIGIW